MFYKLKALGTGDLYCKTWALKQEVALFLVARSLLVIPVNGVLTPKYEFTLLLEKKKSLITRLEFLNLSGNFRTHLQSQHMGGQSKKPELGQVWRSTE